MDRWGSFSCAAYGTRLPSIHGLLWLSHAEPYEPGTTSARYEDLAGTPAQRVEWFRALFHFGIAVDEWERLPWWQPQMYMEELSRYLRIQAGDERPEDTPISGDISDGDDDLGVIIEKVN